MAEKIGSEVLYQDLTAKYATWPSGGHVGFMTGPFGVGLGVPITYAKTASGYSFSGKIPVCTATLKCTNGQPQVLHISVVGKVDTVVEPDEMSYTYTIQAFCGGAVTCNETGTFTGKRTGGTSASVEGVFYGTQQWTLQCCPLRHKPRG
jgi:hypothetical protein